MAEIRFVLARFVPVLGSFIPGLGRLRFSRIGARMRTSFIPQELNTTEGFAKANCMLEDWQKLISNFARPQFNTFQQTQNFYALRTLGVYVGDFNQALFRAYPRPPGAMISQAHIYIYIYIHIYTGAHIHQLRIVPDSCIYRKSETEIESARAASVRIIQ